MAYDLHSHRLLALIIVVINNTFCLVEKDLKPNQKVIGNSHDICATIVSVSICSQASHNCSSQGSQFWKSVDYFLSLGVYITPYTTMKANHWMQFLGHCQFDAFMFYISGIQ